MDEHCISLGKVVGGFTGLILYINLRFKYQLWIIIVNEYYVNHKLKK